MKFAKGDAIAWHHRLQLGLDVASARVYIVLAIGEGTTTAARSDTPAGNGNPAAPRTSA